MSLPKDLTNKILGYLKPIVVKYREYVYSSYIYEDGKEVKHGMVIKHEDIEFYRNGSRDGLEQIYNDEDDRAWEKNIYVKGNLVMSNNIYRGKMIKRYKGDKVELISLCINFEDNTDTDSEHVIRTMEALLNRVI